MQAFRFDAIAISHRYQISELPAMLQASLVCNNAVRLVDPRSLSLSNAAHRDYLSLANSHARPGRSCRVGASASTSGHHLLPIGMCCYPAEAFGSSIDLGEWLRLDRELYAAYSDATFTLSDWCMDCLPVSRSGAARADSILLHRCEMSERSCCVLCI